MQTITLATLGVSLLMLIFSKSPFSVLIYSMIAVQSLDWSAWGIATGILLISQYGYAIRKEIIE